MKKATKILPVLIASMLFSTACIKDLDVTPLDPREVTSLTVFDSPESYKFALAKLYAGLAITGQEGPAGMADISGIDEGFGQYLRALYYHQVLTTDEAVIGWDDQTIKDYVYQAWGPGDVFLNAMYSRIYYQISLVNEFLRQTTDAKLNDRGVEEQLKNEIQIYRAEARFLRALSYWHALDLFGSVPFVTENDPLGTEFFPPQKTQAELFDFIEEELLEIDEHLIEPLQNQYGRADKAAAWMLLAKLYLNAEVYINTPHYEKVIEYSEKIINAGYDLADNFSHLFNADNNPIDNTDLREVIFAVRYDGNHTQTYGGTTFLIKAALGGDAMNSLDYGVDDKWGGLRTTRNIVELFEDNDLRRTFFSDGHNLDIDDLSSFTDGYAVVKFTNLRRDGSPGSNLSFADTDFPMFRLADVYLMYAEAHLRGGGGSEALAVEYFNKIRERAFGDDSQNIATLTKDRIIDERARELLWEGHRRTDLIRFGRFTGGDYVWPWKGNVAEGIGTHERYDLFPIPFTDITANPNLEQNPNY